MSYRLEHRGHGEQVAAAVGDSRVQDVFLVSAEGHRLYTSSLLLRLHSPLLSSLLDQLPPSLHPPGLSLPLLPAAPLHHLLRLLHSGATSATTREELLGVEAAAVTLGVSLPNCVLVGKAGKVEERAGGRAVQGVKMSQVAGGAVVKQEDVRRQGSEAPHRKFQCSVGTCGRKYSRKRQLKRHMSDKHPGEVQAFFSTEEPT